MTWLGASCDPDPEAVVTRRFSDVVMAGQNGGPDARKVLHRWHKRTARPIACHFVYKRRYQVDQDGDW